MPIARTKRERVHQVARWLREVFPPSYPTRVIVRSLSKKHEGLCRFVADSDTDWRCVISVDVGLTRSAALSALLHEWAHARTPRAGTVEELRAAGGDAAWHDDEFYLELGRIERRFLYRDGWKDSGRY